MLLRHSGTWRTCSNKRGGTGGTRVKRDHLLKQHGGVLPVERRASSASPDGENHARLDDYQTLRVVGVDIIHPHHSAYPDNALTVRRSGASVGREPTAGRGEVEDVGSDRGAAGEEKPLATIGPHTQVGP